jgi:hypothetical protein
LCLEGRWLRAKAPDYSNYFENIAQKQENSMVYRAHGKPFQQSLLSIKRFRLFAARECPGACDF